MNWPSLHDKMGDARFCKVYKTELTDRNLVAITKDKRLHQPKRRAGVTVSFFPSQFFPRGKDGPDHSFLEIKMTGQFFPPEKDLTSQFFPHPVSFSPHVIFSEKA